MCKIGDILLIQRYKHNNVSIGKHPFIVIEDKGGEVKGLFFDFIGLPMSSFKSDEQKEKKLRYLENFHVKPTDENMVRGNDKEGYIKADQFYYFSKDTVEFDIIGSLNYETVTRLFERISSFPQKGISIEQVIDNL